MNCFIDYRTTEEEINNLIKLGFNTIKVPKTPLVYSAIDGHVDIQLNILNKEEKLIIVQKDISESFLRELDSNKIEYILSKNSLGNSYPKDIILNSLILKKHFIHNTNHTDPNLMKTQINKNIINVKQGYTKCSVLPLNDDALITSDKGISTELRRNGYDVLLVPAGDIILPSLNYGFIGGTGGMISENKLALFGELSNYMYGEEIKKFLNKYDIEAISLRKGKLIDRGSIFCI